MVIACGSKEAALRAANALSGGVDADSMGAKPTEPHNYPMREPGDLVESSAAVISPALPDVVFTINDSGNDPVLFAMDTSGNLRGRWKIDGASNKDWEAASRGPCTSVAPATTATAYCLFIGDVGDNGAVRKVVTLYQLAEPLLSDGKTAGSIAATRLSFRYPDFPHDVEAMYVGADRTTYLITKRPLKDGSGALRRSLVFAIPASAWLQRDTVVATLVDSLAIVPGSSAWRSITDASLSSDSRLLAVRTYGQVYVFATDSLTGRVLNAIPPTICNIEGVETKRGEGVTWTGNNTQLLLTNEGRNAPMHRITCPLPQR
ncbi:MAG: hypothetical protein ABI852_01490 [Gemmatimonadaceae bacterium]